MLANNPWLVGPAEDDELVWGEGKFYDTTVPRKHPYWKRYDLPTPTKDLNQLRHDFFDWGFCLIEDAIGEESRIVLRARLEEQAEAERIAKIAHFTPFFQIVWYLINKGECFRRCIEHDPEWIQGARVIEQLLNEFLGKRWYSYSMAGNISYPGCKPSLFTKIRERSFPCKRRNRRCWSIPCNPPRRQRKNGGTLLIPSSHRILSEAGSGGEVGELPPAINLEAPAGTVMLFDGRTLQARVLTDQKNGVT
ncbi:MAG: hypothetical protein Ct9H300mP8_06110 [Gammaproteobacteria bacterium]|nr:MAG: hypothetical protein Ct9H300mP8_06110 [Gammaproteobacteria bacterium]